VDDFIEMNRANWDDRAAAHAASSDYGLDRFVADPSYLSEVVRFDLRLLGDVSGRRGVHLQCHIGTDTLSLARLGATMTGLDFSSRSLSEARRLSEVAGPPVEFVHADVYDAADVLAAGTFDLVYTGVGALCWLPSIDRWAATVARLLRPRGRLFIREGHPMLWALDEDRPHGPVVRYPYFEHAQPLLDDDDVTYVFTDQVFIHNATATWNHGLGEIVTALLGHGMQLTGLTEHDSVPWNALPGQMEPDARGEWRLRQRPERLAASYTLQAIKQG
jgi:SAM-dependent methyltransferase